LQFIGCGRIVECNREKLTWWGDDVKKFVVAIAAAMTGHPCHYYLKDYVLCMIAEADAQDNIITNIIVLLLLLLMH